MDRDITGTPIVSFRIAASILRSMNTGNAFISTKQEGPVPTVSFPQHCFTPLMER
jgi:hypothetical protein